VEDVVIEIGPVEDVVIPQREADVVKKNGMWGMTAAVAPARVATAASAGRNHRCLPGARAGTTGLAQWRV
jgi:hypothetical protein